jgi:methionyl-tRNA formyltransferase
MRIIFAGSPAIAVPALALLADLTVAGNGLELAGVLTKADRRRSRRGQPEPTEVGKALAGMAAAFAARGRPLPALLKPEGLDGPVLAALAALKPDLLVSFAYGRIFSPRFLALFPRGGINIHPSLLPRYRGATPIPQAILRRDRETGITIQRLAAEMDAGDILAQEAFPLTGRETTASLSEEAGKRGAALLASVLPDLLRGTLRGRPQDHRQASFCRIIRKEDGRINWNDGAAEIDAQIRAFTPWPLCRTVLGEGELYILAGRVAPEALPTAQALPTGALPTGTVLGIDKAGGILIQTGDGIFAAERLQYPAKKALDWRAFLNGARNFIGSRLT